MYKIFILIFLYFFNSKKQIFINIISYQKVLKGVIKN